MQPDSTLDLFAYAIAAAAGIAATLALRARRGQGQSWLGALSSPYRRLFARRHGVRVRSRVFEAMNDGAIVVDMSDHLVDINQAARECLALDDVQPQGQPITEVLARHPDLVELFRGAVDGHSVFTLEHDHGSSTYDLQLTALRDELGMITSRILVLRDISERVHAEQERSAQAALIQMAQTVSVAANDAETARRALTYSLRHICETFECDVGHAYVLSQDEPPVLCCDGVWWTSHAADFDAFIRATAETHYPSPDETDRATLLASPIWDDPQLEESGRAEAAQRVGLASGLRFPILIAGEIYAILEFFATRRIEANAEALHMLQHIGQIVGRAIERKQTGERIRELAFIDSLTGLPNRQQFQKSLGAAVGIARRGGRQLALLFLDLDGFKKVNDTLGHAAGDLMLREVAARFSKSLRQTDRVSRAQTDDTSGVSRLGGDEFTVLLSEVNGAEGAARVARRLIETLSTPIPVGAQTVHGHISIGIAIFPDDSPDPDTLLRNADRAMYHAKERGTNLYQFYSEAINCSSERKLRLESMLRDALERGEFDLYFQPIRSGTTTQVTGTEALLRWPHPEEGLISPEEFVPIAEEMGLIRQIGEWVLVTACEQGRAWIDAGYRPIRVGVNVSGHQIRDPDFAASVQRALEGSGFSAGQLELEITETTIMQDDDITNSTLRELKEMGVGISLDDFGTGYSSLSYLRRFELDRVKIDRSFVRELTTNPDDAALTQAVIAMAHGLRIHVVAEGVETEEHAAILREQGCDELQGYLFSRAVPPADFVRFLELEKDDTDAFG